MAHTANLLNATLVPELLLTYYFKR